MGNLQYVFELLGTLLFAISGALAVRDREADLFGATFTGFVTAIGGGTLRDIMLGSYPLTWISDILFLYAIMLGALVAYLFFKFLVRLSRTFLFFDAMGISLFTILGVEKALSLGVRPEIAAIMGMFSAVMGGVIRDTLINETRAPKAVKHKPSARQKSHPVKTPPFQIDAIDVWDDLTYVAISQAGRIAFLKTGEQQSGWKFTHIDRLKGLVNLQDPAGQVHSISLQR